MAAPFQTGVFFLPSIGSRERMEAGMAGRDPALYQEMLADIRELSVIADELDYDAIAFTEHHFHIEGFEISNNPVLLDTYVALHTKRIRVGQLGIVLPANSPLRVAEDIAMLDHISGGRAFAGFARGYQRRWVDTLAQQYHDVHAAPSAQRDEEVDRVNRAAFEEFFETRSTRSRPPERPEHRDDHTGSHKRVADETVLTENDSESSQGQCEHEEPVEGRRARARAGTVPRSPNEGAKRHDYDDGDDTRHKRPSGCHVDDLVLPHHVPT